MRKPFDGAHIGKGSFPAPLEQKSKSSTPILKKSVPTKETSSELFNSDPKLVLVFPKCYKFL